ncbi:uncharacterized protein METZ01_LOCUS392745, partial [marine metagenome]
MYYLQSIKTNLIGEAKDDAIYNLDARGFLFASVDSLF